jgi:hypothetical protein
MTPVLPTGWRSAGSAVHAHRPPAALGLSDLIRTIACMAEGEFDSGYLGRYLLSRSARAGHQGHPDRTGDR